jgi:hypothetical protein
MSIVPFSPYPATGAAFIGREGLIRNLRAHMAKGEPLAVIGGPKLGKTSLVRSALDGLADQKAIEIDLEISPSPRLNIVPGSIVILDNLDRIPVSAIEFLLRRVSAAGPSSVVITGGRQLRTLLSHSRTVAGVRFRLYPLSVLLDGELRRLIGSRPHAPLAMWTGNHPYLTKLLLHYGDNALEAGKFQWEPFVQQLVDEVGEGPERQLLCYLIEQGKPVNPTLAGSDTGIRDIKAVSDRLVYLGVISRWIRNEEATLFAGCRLLNDFITNSTQRGVG